ncbi:MAG: FAD-dependent oxidoreductase [Desulfobacterales bacterium]|uniref:FAD-dependent oxidoreductase n=1 Tax=Candidatus Desulfatibia profunda TaxID=2841695 RepID=A0A8J6NQV1_9BACT|nr:FAD-dependent oxidoreductase [Candidatus Desulfatibia profunda]MBL7178627.1 FAD-dependent oxidoreductase [Desulfobacterales bacterium]
MKPKRLLIVGGVAGGASCAARARRLSEDAEIIVFERGRHVSFANCGLPYYVGNVITKERSLIIASPQIFKKRFNIDVRTENNVRRIDRKNKTIGVENLKTGEVYQEHYDALVLAPGAAALKPNLEGIDLPGIFTVKTIPDTKKIIDWITTRDVKRAAVVGGGFIGLEMAENLKIRGIDVTIIEMLPQVMATLDPEMATFIHDHLTAKGVSLSLGSPVTGFKSNSAQMIDIMLASGRIVTTDMVILAVGVRPEIQLAKTADLTIGNLGGISVDGQMRTSDENIWAVGDAVEVNHFVTGTRSLALLAGPANRQGRIAADAIMGNASIHPHRFRGAQATSICGVLSLTVAATGVTEKFLKQLNSESERQPYEKIYLHPDHHAGYYPGAKTITIKLIFSPLDGKILGAQAVGTEGVDKRIDVIAMAIQQQGTVFDLEEAELCYAPQYGSAKDPVNLAGMIASNVLRGYSQVVHWEDLNASDAFILDVSEPFEFNRGHVENAVNIPLGQLRQRITELPRNREIWSYCSIGLRSYFALRLLSLLGFKVKNISGGYTMYQAVQKAQRGSTIGLNKM